MSTTAITQTFAGGVQEIETLLASAGIDVSQVRINKGLLSKIAAIIAQYVNKIYHLVGDLAVKKSLAFLTHVLEKHGYTLTVSERDLVTGTISRYHEIGEKQIVFDSPTPPEYVALKTVEKKKNVFQRLFSRKPKAAKQAK